MLQRDYSRKHYQKNKKYYVDKAASQEKRNQEYLKNYLRTHPCVDCGETDVVVLEFDHVRGIKRSEVTQLAANGCSLITLDKEIAKCEVRCANDHKRATHFRRLRSRGSNG